jgi:hypothetical protein
VFNENISYNSLDFIHRENEVDRNELALAGSLRDTEGPADMDKLRFMRVINSKNYVSQDYFSGEGFDALGQFTQVRFIRYNQKTNGLIATTD